MNDMKYLIVQILKLLKYLNVLVLIKRHNLNSIEFI